MADDKNAGESKVGADGFKTMASEGNSSSPAAKSSGGDMFESLGAKKSQGSTSSPPVSQRSAPPPPPTSERMPLPEAKRTLLGIPSPTTPVSAPPPSIPGARATSPSLPAVAPPPPPRSPVPPAPGTQPANGAASPAKAVGPGGLEMDWDDENEATHVFDKDSQGNQKAAAPAASLAAPNTTPTTARGTGTPPPPPPASASMRAAAKAISAPPPAIPGNASVSQAVGPISAAQSERVIGAGTPPPPPGLASAGSVPPPSMRRSTPPPPPSAMSQGAQRPSAPPPPPASTRSPAAAPASLPPQPTHAPLVATLASASGGVPSQPPAAAPAVQVTTAPMAMPQLRTDPPRPLEATALVHPTSSGRGWVGIGLGLLGAAIGAFALVLYLNSRGGTLTITATDAKGGQLDHVNVFVDGTKTKCETSPCNLELGSGQHTIKVISDGLGTPEPKLVTIEAGKNLPVPFEFKGDAVPSTSATAAAGGTGLKIATAGTGLKLFVDGAERGTLPQELKDLKVGDHKIRISGNDRYQALEKTVTVTQGSVLDLGTVTPKVIKGKATIELDTPGAKLSLQAPGEPTRVLSVPVPPLDLDTSKGWTLHASKSGFDDLVLPLTFADGETAEKTFTVTLSPKGAAAPATNTTTTSTGSSKPSTTGTSTTATTTTTAPATGGTEAKGDATLTISSMPASKVVIDGAPAGETPVMNKTVSAGSHRIMLINSDQDLKKTVTVKVKAGETKKVIVNLKE